MVIVQYDQDLSLSLGTLGAVDAIAQASAKIDAGRENGFRIAKLNIMGTLTGKTATEGPIAWGIACNMNAAEIELAIESDPQDSAENDDRGVGTWLKPLGMITLEQTAGPLTGGGSGGTQGGVATMIEVKVNWSVLEGHDFTVWAYNQGSALTTGAILTFFVEYFGVWLRD